MSFTLLRPMPFHFIILLLFTATLLLLDLLLDIYLPSPYTTFLLGIPHKSKGTTSTILPFTLNMIYPITHTSYHTVNISHRHFMHIHSNAFIHIHSLGIPLNQKKPPPPFRVWNWHLCLPCQFLHSSQCQCPLSMHPGMYSTPLFVINNMYPLVRLNICLNIMYSFIQPNTLTYYCFI